MAVVLVQRVKGASVILESGEERSTGKGLLVYVGFEREDTPEVIPKIARKVVNLRVFEDAVGKMNLSVKDVGGEILLIPNFTLAGDAKKGNRPSFGRAKHPEEASGMFLALFEELKGEVNVQRGEFGTYMRIISENDGPVNIIVNFR